MSGGSEIPGGRGSRLKIGLRVALVLAAIFVLTLLFFYLSSLYAGGLHGRVGMVENPEAPRDSIRFIPATDAEVMITWQAAKLDNFTRASSTCVRAVMARTDENGEFKVAGKWLAPRWPPLSKALTASYVLKHGYVAHWDYVRLVPDHRYTTVLVPAPMNPWTGLELPDEDPIKQLEWQGCPELERL